MSNLIATQAWVLVLAAYLIGSVSFAIIVAKLMGLPDPRSFGSGNPGATNMLRSGRKLAAALTLLGDGFKGWLPLWVALHWTGPWVVSDRTLAAMMLAVVAGHMWPVFFRFQGGKGVATSAGVLLAVNPWVGLATLACWAVVFAVGRISSLAALTAAALAPVFAYFWIASPLVQIAVWVIALTLIYRHKANVVRLIKGEEKRMGKP